MYIYDTENDTFRDNSFYSRNMAPLYSIVTVDKTIIILNEKLVVRLEPGKEA